MTLIAVIELVGAAAVLCTVVLLLFRSTFPPTRELRVFLGAVLVISFLNHISSAFEWAGHGGEQLDFVIDHCRILTPVLWLFFAYTYMRESFLQQLRMKDQRMLQAQRLESIGVLTSGIAHDFNNLLTPIVAYCERALDTLKEGEPFYEEFSRIAEAAKSAAWLAGEMVQFGKTNRRTTCVIDLRAELDRFCRVIQPLLGDNIHFSIEYEQDELLTILGEPVEIEQVMMNLLLNARDAIVEEGSISVLVRKVSFDPVLGEEESDKAVGSYVLIEITDSGHGIPQEQLKEIFEPFFTTKDVELGTGLGLSTVADIVRQHGGFIEVDSSTDCGSTFRIYFPQIDRPQEVADVVAPLPIFVQGCSDASILVVEDNTLVLEMLLMLFEESDYSVRAVSGPAPALELVNKEGFHVDLLITDVSMPGMSGLQLFYELRNHFEELNVIFMSGGLSEKVTHALEEFPDNARFFAKPLSTTALLDEVNALLATSGFGERTGRSIAEK